METLVATTESRPRAPKAARPATITSHHEAVSRVIEAMRSHLDEPLSLRAMAKIAYVSPYYFNRTFRQVTGIPPCQFLYALRLEAARKLLLTTRDGIVDICYKVGYNSLGTFTRRFAGLLGAPPARFRLLARSPLTDLLHHLESRSDSEHRVSSCCLQGTVTAPADFSGHIFVGLFTDPIPQGNPIACAVLTQPGAFRLPAAPDGNYYLFSLALEAALPAEAYFHYDSALRGGGQAIRILHGSVEGSGHICLRRPTPFDPPILVGLPCLLQPAHPETDSYAAKLSAAAAR